jgi:hypothetical protein
MYAVHAVLILRRQVIAYPHDCPTPNSFTSSSTPTPTRLDFFAIRIKGVAAARCLPCSIRRHGAITIISTSTWEDISYWVIPTFLKAGGR